MNFNLDQMVMMMMMMTTQPSSCTDLVLQAGDLLRELRHALRVLGVPDPGQHQVLLHPGLQVRVLALGVAQLRERREGEGGRGKEKKTQW